MVCCHGMLSGQPMKNFKEMLDKDLDSTFYNLSEFAQLKRVECDGIDKKIPVILDSEETKERQNLVSGDNAEGFYGRYIVVRVRLSDMEREPASGMRFWIDSNLFMVTDVRNEYKELVIGLERYDE